VTPGDLKKMEEPAAQEKNQPMESNPLELAEGPAQIVRSDGELTMLVGQSKQYQRNHFPGTCPTGECSRTPNGLHITLTYSIIYNGKVPKLLASRYSTTLQERCPIFNRRQRTNNLQLLFIKELLVSRHADNQ